MAKVREAWPDAVKIVACILVVLGHFTQSMMKSGIMPAGNVYGWFQMTIYTFHVPLFFICSGYLYQRYTKMASFGDWWSNVLKKLVVLGVPYFFFTTMTLAMKVLAGGAVNDAIEYGPLETLFLRPTSPYWYLYALFFMFLVTPVVHSKRSMSITLGIAASAKAVSLVGGAVQLPYCISILLIDEIWFVFGMAIAWSNLQNKLGKREALGGLAFLPLSVLVYAVGLGAVAEFCIGLLACLCIVSGAIWLGPRVASSRIFKICVAETMPVYLMHTIFAASFRAVLIKAGVIAAIPHISLGLAVSFVGPAFAMWLMEKLHPLDFLVFPNRYLKMQGSSR